MQQLGRKEPLGLEDSRSLQSPQEGSGSVMWRLKFDFRGSDVLAWLGRIRKDFPKAKKSRENF